MWEVVNAGGEVLSRHRLRDIAQTRAAKAAAQVRPYRSQRKRHRAETVEYLEMCARVLDTAGRRVAASDPPDLAQLIGLADNLADAIRTAVAGQRSSGIGWSWIAEATGTSVPAAIQKWGRYCQPGSRYLPT